jgi:trans-aconitate 2-methyltransferase
MPHEFNGEAYKKASDHQKEWGNKIIDEFTLKGNECILDLGCGDGVLTAQLAELVPNGFVLGIDSSQGMIEVAQKLRRPNLEFKLQDIDSFNYNETFDLIFSNATLHWIKNHSRLLEYTFRGLRKNGKARFNFAADGNCFHFFKVVKEAIVMPQFVQYFKSFSWPWYMPTIAEYERLTGQSQFIDAKVWGEVADRIFPDKEAMIKWVDQPSIVPFLEHIPIEDSSSFRNHVVQKMIDATLQADGKCFETFRRINFSGRKLS